MLESLAADHSCQSEIINLIDYLVHRCTYCLYYSIHPLDDLSSGYAVSFTKESCISYYLVYSRGLYALQFLYTLKFSFYVSVSVT
jgi:hypothetical protein